MYRTVGLKAADLFLENADFIRFAPYLDTPMLKTCKKKTAIFALQNSGQITRNKL